MTIEHQARIRLPTTLGFAPLDDRRRLPGRFFYRRLAPGLRRLS